MGETIEGEVVQRGKKRPPRRTYTDTEKAGIMFQAVQLGVQPAARAAGVPPTTIRRWFDKHTDMVRNVRSVRAEQVADAYLEAENTVYDVVRKGLESGEIKGEQLMTTFRKFIEARTAPPPKAGTQAAALAKSEIHIHVDD